MFSLASREYLDVHARELSDDQRQLVVTDAVGSWFVKSKPNPPHSSDQEKRDRLAYLLGAKFANIAEVRLLTEEELTQVKSASSISEVSSRLNTWLVRLAGSYSVNELRRQTLESAVATELVFSTWIRRRDAHVANRVYVDQIPIFFDFQTAFLGESELADINVFFSEGWDYGYAGRWRAIETTERLDTAVLRNRNPEPNEGAYHYVRSLQLLGEEIAKAKGELVRNMRIDLIGFARKSGFDNDTAVEIGTFLLRNLKSLDSDVVRMEKIIGQS